MYNRELGFLSYVRCLVAEKKMEKMEGKFELNAKYFMLF
jgi:hypothetical protein